MDAKKNKEKCRELLVLIFTILHYSSCSSISLWCKPVSAQSCAIGITGKRCLMKCLYGFNDRDIPSTNALWSPTRLASLALWVWCEQVASPHGTRHSLFSGYFLSFLYHPGVQPYSISVTSKMYQVKSPWASFQVTSARAGTRMPSNTPYCVIRTCQRSRVYAPRCSK